MDENRVDKSVIFGFPWKTIDTAKINNNYIIEAVQKYPQRFIGLACIDPFNEHAVSEAARCIEGGLAGIGELAFYQSGIDEAALIRLEPIMELCRSKELPVLIHTNEPVGHVYPGKTPNTLNQIYRLLKQFPENKIVLAHWGGGIFFFSLLKKEVKDTFVNAYFDTAASPFLYDPEIYRVAIRAVGHDKILFGSDYPLLKPDRYFKELEQAGLTKMEMESICGDNAARLLKL
jgi:predicted TIM-barrel fold metal-dependent hydrolase